MRIGRKEIGDGHPCYVVAEIGINHNGDLDLAHRMIAEAKACGADAVKFQKRTVDAVYSPEELAAARVSPFGVTNGELKRGLEFSRDQYLVLSRYCEQLEIAWFASPWDVASADELCELGAVALKVPSALVTDEAYLEHLATLDLPVLLSTGMSSEAEVERAYELLEEVHLDDQLALLACTAAYPAKVEDLNLRRIRALRQMFGTPVGWSGHEVGVFTSVAAVALGACIVERHFTLDRSMWGSDQAASLEPKGFAKMVEEIRTLERALGTGELRRLPCEEPAAAKLRKVK